MKLGKLLGLLENVDPDKEVYVNTNDSISDVVLHENKVIIEIENSLEAYYNHQGKLQMLRDLIKEIQEDNIIEISELEVVELAHKTELDCVDVVEELNKANILISKGI